MICVYIYLSVRCLWFHNWLEEYPHIQNCANSGASVLGTERGRGQVEFQLFYQQTTAKLSKDPCRTVLQMARLIANGSSVRAIIMQINPPDPEN